MRRKLFIFVSAIFFIAIVPAAAPAFAAGEDASPAPPISCGNGIPGGVNCLVSKKELKEARKAFDQGIKLQNQRLPDQAFARFDEATRLAPQNMQFLTAREVAKAQLVFNHVEHGNLLLLEDARLRAAAEFRAALELDADNDYARERLAEATRVMTPMPPPTAPVGLEDSGEIHLAPNNDLATFHYSGEVRGLFAQLAAAYGVKAQFDDSVQTRQVVFNVDNVDFFTALKLICEVSKTMWAALDAHQMLIAADNTENHKQYDRMSLRTFILPAHSTPQETTDLVTTMRNMFDLHFVSSGLAAGTVEVRGPPHMLEAASELLDQLNNQRPQVMLDVRVYQINHQLTRNIGLHIPNTFNMYNIPAVALIGLAGGQNIQQLINQLISSGGINQVGSSALSGLLAQLGGQNGGIFSQPLATFGGGLTFSGVSLDQLAAMLSLNESWVRSLENMQMRASQGNEATFHLGERYPIQNASYAPIYNSPAISAVLGNQSYVPPFPSVSYEDLGLNLKAKPTVHGDGSVALQLELEVRSLTGQSNNGVPVISNREYKGSINLKDGEPAVVAGEVSQTDTLSMSGIPGLGFLPVLNQAMVNNTKQSETDELMIIITPHVVANINPTTPEIWLSGK
ncbi:MAG TPA: type II and III secretion system protein [Candidatus Sulfotelmatobacter sp.]|jgi:tetratricopeptide (TPR) repeat protein